MMMAIKKQFFSSFGGPEGGGAKLVFQTFDIIFTFLFLKKGKRKLLFFRQDIDTESDELFDSPVTSNWIN